MKVCACGNRIYEFWLELLVKFIFINCWIYWR